MRAARAGALALALLLPHSLCAPPAIALYGLVPPGAPAAAEPAALRRALLAAAGALGALAGAALDVPADGLVPVPAPAGLDLSGDDRIGVPARAELAARARRSWGDLGDRRAVALYLAHAAAWQRFVDSGAPVALVLLDPASADGGGGGPSGGGPSSAFPAAAAAALWDAFEADGAGGAWHLALLSAAVAPALARAPAAPALARAGWRVPEGWRGWDGYLISRRGAQVLLAQSALPMTARAEAHASALVNLGILSALALAGPAGPGAGGGVARVGAAGAGAGDAAGEPPAAQLDSDAAAATLRGLLFEARCDLCALPADYSRSARYAAVAAPAALAGFALALGVRALLLAGAASAAGAPPAPRAGARSALPASASMGDLC